MIDLATILFIAVFIENKLNVHFSHLDKTVNTYFNKEVHVCWLSGTKQIQNQAKQVLLKPYFVNTLHFTASF